MKGSLKFYAGRGWVVQYYDPQEKKRIFKTFKQQDDAEYFKAHLNVSRKEGKLDARDYAKDNPLGFRTQAERWLAYRKSKVKDLRHAEAHINRAIAFFGGRSIKEIQYAELDDFLTSLREDLSSKTKHNIFTTLHTFWTWVYNREKKRGFVMPDWPETKFTLGWRQIVDKETQAAIIDEVKRISYHRNPRTWFAIFLLASYPKVRPGELIQVNEKDVNRITGEMWIRHTKEGKEKRIYLLEEDLAFVNSLPVGLPDLPFFRHERMKGIPGVPYEDIGPLREGLPLSDLEGSLQEPGDQRR